MPVSAALWISCLLFKTMSFSLLFLWVVSMYFDCEGRGIGVEVSGGYRGSGADDGNRDLGGSSRDGDGPGIRA